MNSQPMTFGVEIELLVLATEVGDNGFQYKLACDLNDEDGVGISIDPRELVAKKLERFLENANLPGVSDTKVSYACPSHLYSSFSVIDDSSVDIDLDREAEFRKTGKLNMFGDKASRWLHEHAHEIPYEIRKKSGFHAVEIISSILTADRKGFAVVQAIYDDFINSLPFVADESASLHVHVARGRWHEPNGSLGLNAVKRLAQVAMCAEFQLSCFQSEHRAGSLYCTYNTSALPGMRDPANAFSTIGEFEDLEELLITCETGLGMPRTRNHMVNMSRVGHVRPDGLACTVEFRACDSTVSGDRAVTWARFMVDLFAVATKGIKPLEFLTGYDTSVSPEQFLWDISLKRYIGRLPVYDLSDGYYLFVREERDQRFETDDERLDRYLELCEQSDERHPEDMDDSDDMDNSEDLDEESEN